MPRKKTKKETEAASIKEKEASQVQKWQKPSFKTLVLFVAGILLCIGFISYKIYSGSVLSFYKAPRQKTVHDTSATDPTTIQFLPSQYSLPVNRTTIAENKWEIAPEGASYLSTSARPGEKGSIIIYAHNTKNRFAILKDLEEGDTISIKAKNGELHSYAVREKLTVKPSNTSVLDSPDRETLILYTCTGFADTKRLVIKAYPL